MDAKRRDQMHRASQRYNNRVYEPLTIRVRKDGKDGYTVDDLRHAAERDGMSLNAWITTLIRDNI